MGRSGGDARRWSLLLLPGVVSLIVRNSSCHAISQTVQTSR
jgi:hypothetical protein